MNFYAEPCSCSKSLARSDTGCCEMCSVFPVHLQFRDTRYYPLCTRCGGCGIRLTQPRSRYRGYCEECALTAAMPDPADGIVTEQQAIALLRAVFHGIRLIEPEEDK